MNLIFNRYRKMLRNTLLLIICTFYITNLKAAQFTGATAFQITGTVNLSAKKQPILYVQLDAVTTASGKWGIDGVRFISKNTSNTNVKSAKVYLNNISSISGATFQDSISNPGDTMNFVLNITNLGASSVFLFLVYNIADSTGCTDSFLDAMVDSSSLSITGLGSGLYTPVNPDPTGSRTLLAPLVVPSVSIAANNTNTCNGSSVTFTPTPINGGSNPSYEWYVNNVLQVTNNGAYTTSTLANADAVKCKLLSSKACANPATIFSNTITVSATNFNQVVTITSEGLKTIGNTVRFTALSNYGGTSPTYQWIKNNLNVGNNSETYMDSTLQNGDTVYCKVTSSNVCALPVIASSNKIGIVFTKSEQSRDVALLDLSAQNNELNGSNLYSAKHMLDVAGVAYKIVTDIFEAQNYKMILGTSSVYNGVFSADEIQVLTTYVSRGGVVFFTKLKTVGLYPVFGVGANQTTNTRYRLKWNMASNDASLKWFDDSLEQTISLGDSSYTSIISTLDYNLTGASMLGSYEDGSIASTVNKYGTGYAYTFGIQLKDIVLRNQLNTDFDAQRTYTNAFEPTTDDLFLLMRALYNKHVSNGVWKHTSPHNTKATLIVTHDIDATTAMNLLDAYSDYEDSVGIKATYFVNVHYNNDIVSNFYDPGISQVIPLIAKHQNVASHSVGHFVDMNDSTIVPTGAPGNTKTNYHPHNNGGATIGATCWGEMETSKNILQTDIGITIRSYRPGYLLVHPSQFTVLKALNYEYSSSFTAPDLLTNFPFFQHEFHSSDSQLTNIMEIPLATSDVVRDFTIDSITYTTLISRWKNVIVKNYANNAPTVLLIHPTRDYKLWAQRGLINQLPAGFAYYSIEGYGDYWRKRLDTKFTSTLAANNLTIVIENASLPLDSNFSLVVDNGQNLNSITVKDESNNPIAFDQSNWDNNGKILYFINNVTGINNASNTTDSENNFSAQAIPNPFSGKTEISFRMKHAAFVSLDVYNSLGEKVASLIHENMQEGTHQQTLDAANLSKGVYFFKLSIGEKSVMHKIVLSK